MNSDNLKNKQIDAFLDNILPDEDGCAVRDLRDITPRANSQQTERKTRRNKDENSFPTISPPMLTRKSFQISQAKLKGRKKSQSMPEGSLSNFFPSPPTSNSPKFSQFSPRRSIRMRSVPEGGYLGKSRDSFSFADGVPTPRHKELRSQSANNELATNLHESNHKLPNIKLRDTKFIIKAFKKTESIRSSIDNTDRLLNQHDIKPRPAKKKESFDDPTEDEITFLESLRTRKFYGEVEEATLRVDHFLRKLDLPTWAIEKKKELHRTEETDEDADDPEMHNYLCAGVRFNQEAENQERAAIMEKLKGLSDKLAVDRGTENLLTGVGRWLTERQTAANVEMLLLFQAEQDLANGIEEIKRSEQVVEKALHQRSLNVSKQAEKMMHHLKKRHSQHKEILSEKEKEDAKKKATAKFARTDSIIDKDRQIELLKDELNLLEEEIRQSKGTDPSLSDPGTLAQDLQEHYEKKREHLEHIIQGQKAKIAKLTGKIVDAQKQNDELNELVKKQMEEQQSRVAKAGGTLAGVIQAKKQTIQQNHMMRQSKLGQAHNELLELEKARQYREGLVIRNRKLRAQLTDAEKKMGVNRPVLKEKGARLRMLTQDSEKFSAEVEALEEQTQALGKEISEERKVMQKMGMRATSSMGRVEEVFEKVSETELTVLKQENFALQYRLKSLLKDCEKAEEDLRLHREEKENAAVAGNEYGLVEFGDPSRSVLMQKKVAEVGGVIFAFQRIGNDRAEDQIHELLVDYTPITRIVSDVEDAVYDMTMKVAEIAGVPSQEDFVLHAVQMKDSATEKTKQIRSKLRDMEASIISFFEVMGTDGGEDSFFADVQRKFTVAKVAIHGCSEICFVNAILVVITQAAEISGSSKIYEGLDRMFVQYLTGNHQFTKEMAVKSLIGICDFVMEYGKLRGIEMSEDFMEDVQGLTVTQKEPSAEIMVQIDQLTAYFLLHNMEETEEVFFLRTKLEMYVETGKAISPEFLQRAADSLQFGRDRALKQDDFNDIALGLINTALQGVKEISKAEDIDLLCFTMLESKLLLSSLSSQNDGSDYTPQEDETSDDDSDDMDSTNGGSKENDEEMIRTSLDGKFRSASTADSDGNRSDFTGDIGEGSTVKAQRKKKSKQSEKVEKKIERLEQSTDRKLKSITHATVALSKMLSKAPQTIGYLTDTSAVQSFMETTAADSMAYETHRLSVHEKHLQQLITSIKTALNILSVHERLEGVSTYELASDMMKAMYELKIVSPDLDIKKLTEPPPPPPPQPKREKEENEKKDKERKKRSSSSSSSSEESEEESETETETEEEDAYPSRQDGLDVYRPSTEGDLPYSRRNVMAADPNSTQKFPGPWNIQGKGSKKPLPAEILAQLGPTDKLLSLSQTQTGQDKVKQVKAAKRRSLNTSQEGHEKKKTRDQIIKELRKQVRSKKKKLSRLEKEWFKIRHRGKKKKKTKNPKKLKEHQEKILHTLETIFMSKSEKAEANEAIEELKAEVLTTHHKLWILRRKHDKHVQESKKEVRMIKFPTTKADERKDEVHPTLKLVEESAERFKIKIGSESNDHDLTSPQASPKEKHVIPQTQQSFINPTQSPVGIPQKGAATKDVRRRIKFKTENGTRLSSNLKKSFAKSANVAKNVLNHGDITHAKAPHGKEGFPEGNKMVNDLLYAAELQSSLMKQISNDLVPSNNLLFKKGQNSEGFDKALSSLRSKIKDNKQLAQSSGTVPMKNGQPIVGIPISDLHTIHEEDNLDKTSKN